MEGSSKVTKILGDEKWKEPVNDTERECISCRRTHEREKEGT